MEPRGLRAEGRLNWKSFSEGQEGGKVKEKCKLKEGSRVSHRAKGRGTSQAASR